MQKSELRKKAWYRLLQVIFGIVVVLVVALTLVIWYAVGSERIANAGNAYFTCYGFPDQQHSLTNTEKQSLSGTFSYLPDDSRLTQVCHEVYVSGSTAPQTPFDQQLEQAMGTFQDGKNYQMEGITYGYNYHWGILFIALFIEYLALMGIRGIGLYVLIGSSRDT